MFLQHVPFEGAAVYAPTVCRAAVQMQTSAGAVKRFLQLYKFYWNSVLETESLQKYFQIYNYFAL